ncbi:5-oxoprolinase isoform X2 [Leptinotarsa decemlineata]|uniref:5-oxoprolinase isoform X2 n=1 Tax=Leptinotarsa decemlineata TaxID=7539 RepID=UPI003D305B08
MASNRKFRFAIDRGGTFTDVFAKCPGGKIRVLKLLSEDPQHYDDAPTEGIRRILQEETGNALASDGNVDSSLIEWIRMGTTVATNALLERKGEKMAFVTNKGFRDILLIGNQARPKIFDLNIRRPEILHSEIVEVNCRVIPVLNGKCELGNQTSQWRVVEGKTGEQFYVTKELDVEQVKKELRRIKEKGINSISVALAHSYTYFDHEMEVGKIAKEIGFSHVSLSHQVIPMVRIVPRGFTSCADAYLTPHVKRYVEGFSKGFKNNLEGTRVLFMQSDGGLTPMQSFNGARAILSGPAGGVVGCAVTTWQKETNLPVIGFDMGGTSTDVSRFSGNYEHVYESTTAGVTIQAPQLDVNTVAAGGGSMLFFRSGMFVVGPESAGAHPGPVCYKKGGPLTVTDANLALGRLLPEYFPNIFGPDEDSPLDEEQTIEEFQLLTKDINEFLNAQDESEKSMSVEEVAMGFVRVANEAMCRPIRALTQAKGYDTARHALACFGGAGGQHACAIARSLGMTTVFVHKYAGILSAYGMALADVVHESQEPCAKAYLLENFSYFDERLSELKEQCKSELKKQGFPETHIVLEPYLHMRYDGTDCALMCGPTYSGEISPTHGDFMKTFVDRYKSEFGFVIQKRNVIVDDIRVRGIGKSDLEEEDLIATSTSFPIPESTKKVYFEGGYQDTNIYLLKSLHAHQELKGPAIIMDQLSTILVEPDCTAVITKYGDIRITIGSGKVKEIGPDLDSIQLSIFSHRFMSIAEQMGRILQRTSISTNIKERLDFSCALFGADGGLVSNAPHIPVHLGAMQEAVQYQMKTRKTFHEGDVILSNHPGAGGSHLPDFTVITPVFYKGSSDPIFFVASRGHHADIGGITPGSMPPHSTSLDQEGAAFKSFLLVKQDVFQEDEFSEAIRKAGGRNLSDNISDLRAQVAANKKGIDLVCELIDQYGLGVVQAYMGHIQTNAELSVRDMLREVAKDAKQRTGESLLQAEDFMDDGSSIRLKVNLDEKEGSAYCDFSGTGAEVWGNCNAPKAITLSALIYCLRCMVGHDVPLNQGPNWHGCSGVHTHMTNTRITDIEIVERRYPVHVRQFMLRARSGGSGKFRGGDGVLRELMFRAPLTLSVLTERRVLQPYGLEGGGPGARGLNLLIRSDGRTINLGPKTAVPVLPGDVFQLQTPGGGGFGVEEMTGIGEETASRGRDENYVTRRGTFLERGSVFEYRQAQESV